MLPTLALNKAQRRPVRIETQPSLWHDLLSCTRTMQPQSPSARPLHMVVNVYFVGRNSEPVSYTHLRAHETSAHL
eukprot:2624000-Alexandrium_andersonii.AAC.1